MRRQQHTRHLRAQRHAIFILCQVVRERDFRLVADRLMDLSISGALVIPAEPVLTGEPLLVSFQLPGTAHWFDAEAVVQRVVHGRRAGEHARGLGILFEQFLGSNREQFARAVGARPPIPPRWRRGRRDATSVVRRLARTSTRTEPFASIS